MKNPKASAKRAKRARKPVEETQTANTSAPAVASQATTPAPAATAAPLSVRSIAARHSAAGKFNKVNLTQIGGKECPRFAPMTWKERDAFMAKPENALVRERYEKHMALVKSETTA